jgi:hypothetical protein
VFHDRVLLALSHDDPWFEYQDQDVAVIERRYNEDAPRAAAEAILSNAQSLATTLADLPVPAWARSGRRAADEVFDVALLARFTLHEVRHHRIDAECSIVNSPG